MRRAPNHYEGFGPPHGDAPTLQGHNATRTNPNAKLEDMHFPSHHHVASPAVRRTPLTAQTPPSQKQGINNGGPAKSNKISSLIRFFEQSSSNNNNNNNESTATTTASITAPALDDPITVVQTTWAKVRKLGVAATNLFYDKVLSLEPSLRSTLFQPTQLAAQSERFFKMFDTAINMLGGEQDVVLGTMRELGGKHAMRYGVVEHHYTVVVQALLWTLKHALRTEYTLHVQECWEKVLTNVFAEEMVEGARRALSRGLQASELELVQSTWSQLQCIGDRFSELFYEEMFSLQAGMKGTLFRSTDMTVQAKKLTEMIGSIVDMSKDKKLKELVPLLRNLGKLHSEKYNVLPSHYAWFGQTLMLTLEKSLNADFTPEVRDAWTSFLGFVQNIMLSGEEVLPYFDEVALGTEESHSPSPRRSDGIAGASTTRSPPEEIHKVVAATQPSPRRTVHLVKSSRTSLDGGPTPFVEGEDVEVSVDTTVSPPRQRHMAADPSTSPRSPGTGPRVYESIQTHELPILTNEPSPRRERENPESETTRVPARRRMNSPQRQSASLSPQRSVTRPHPETLEYVGTISSPQSRAVNHDGEDHPDRPLHALMHLGPTFQAFREELRMMDIETRLDSPGSVIHLNVMQLFEGSGLINSEYTSIDPALRQALQETIHTKLRHNHHPERRTVRVVLASPYNIGEGSGQDLLLPMTTKYVLDRYGPDEVFPLIIPLHWPNFFLEKSRQVDAVGFSVKLVTQVFQGLQVVMPSVAPYVNGFLQYWMRSLITGPNPDTNPLPLEVPTSMRSRWEAVAASIHKSLFVTQDYIALFTEIFSMPMVVVKTFGLPGVLFVMNRMELCAPPTSWYNPMIPPLSGDTKIPESTFSLLQLVAPTLLNHKFRGQVQFIISYEHSSETVEGLQSLITFTHAKVLSLHSFVPSSVVVSVDSEIASASEGYVGILHSAIRSESSRSAHLPDPVVEKHNTVVRDSLRVLLNARSGSNPSFSGSPVFDSFAEEMASQLPP